MSQTPQTPQTPHITAVSTGSDAEVVHITFHDRSDAAASDRNDFSVSTIKFIETVMGFCQATRNGVAGSLRESGERLKTNRDRALAREMLYKLLEKGSWDHFQGHITSLFRVVNPAHIAPGECLEPLESFLEKAFGAEGHKIAMALVYAGANFTREEHMFFQQWWEDVVLQRNPPCQDSGHAHRSQDFRGPGGSEWAPYREAFEWVFEHPVAVRVLRIVDCVLLGRAAPNK
jgi:hypothetical protein